MTETTSEPRRGKSRRSRYPDRRQVWIVRNPAKRRAHSMVREALRSGALERQRCEVQGCDEPGQAHHEDYDRPLDVTWLCDRHHKARHREMRASQQPAPAPESARNGH